VNSQPQKNASTLPVLGLVLLPQILCWQRFPRIESIPEGKQRNSQFFQASSRTILLAFRKPGGVMKMSACFAVRQRMGIRIGSPKEFWLGSVEGGGIFPAATARRVLNLQLL